MDILIATLDDLKAFRPDLCDQLYQEFLSKQSFASEKKKDKPITKDDNEKNSVQVGDVLRWNYTREEGIVVGFESLGGSNKIIVKQYDGTKINFENNPRLYTILEGDEKEAVISKRKEFLKEEREKGKPVKIAAPLVKNKKKPQTKSATGTTKPKMVIRVKESPENKPTSKDVKIEALVGDTILYDSKRCVVVKKQMSNGSMRLIVKYEDGVVDNVPNDWDRYSVINKEIPVSYTLSPSSDKKTEDDFDIKMYQGNVNIGDWVMRTSDRKIGQVIGIRVLGGGIEKLILKLNNGNHISLFKRKGLYTLLKLKK